mmetsp:Transcript_8648/g.13294  ORF Transcript_8648/g.13294 Transcript_8648/m.13294 type:complete len:102 (-) Transcript_8648:60-365(-)
MTAAASLDKSPTAAGASTVFGAVAGAEAFALSLDAVFAVFVSSFTVASVGAAVCASVTSTWTVLDVEVVLGDAEVLLGGAELLPEEVEAVLVDDVAASRYA